MSTRAAILIQQDEIAPDAFTHRARLWAMVLILGAIIAYLPAISAGFIWDDDLLLTANRQMQDVDGLKNIWLGASSCEYTPVTLTAFWLETRLWGDVPPGYHIVNILLHAVAAVFLWRCLSILRIPGAWLAALLFVVHPVNVASVAWIAELKNTLSAAFFFASILAFVVSIKRPSTRSYVSSLVLFGLAGLSKGSVATMPIVLCGCIFWMNGKIKRSDLPRLLPFLFVAALVSVLTIRYQSHAADYGLVSSNLFFRIARSGTVVWLYLRDILLPIGLSPIAPQWQPDLYSFSTYVPFLLIAASATIFCWKRKTWGRPCLFAAGYYLWMLLPVLGLVWMTLQQEMPCADWWQYLAAPGIFAAIAAGIVIVSRSVKQHVRLCLYAAVCLVVLVLSAQTWRRNAIYQSMETYCRAVVTECPHAWTLQNNLGVEVEHRGKLEQAIACYRQALRDNPRYMDAHNNLGNALSATSRLPEAEAEFRAALRLSPRNTIVLDNLADNYFRQGKIADSFAATAEAIRIDRYNPRRYIEFGQKLAANKQFEQAAICFRNAAVLSSAQR